MKFLVFLLALGNLLFYAFSQGLIGPAEVGESVRITQQIKPESIRIVARGEAPATAPAEKPAAEAAEASVPPATEPATAPGREIAGAKEAAKESAKEPVKEPVKEAGKTAPAATVCLSWETLSQVEGDRVRRVLAAGFDGFTLREGSGENRGWWVSIPPQANKAAADKKASELKALGITEYFIIQEGAQRYAISLGVFSSEKGARDHLARLQDKGVRSARASQRPDKDGKEVRNTEVRGPAERADALRTALAEALPKNAPKACP